MKDKDKLEPLLRAYKLGYVDLNYSVDFILKIYSDSKRFNFHSFQWGMVAGIILYLVVDWFV